VCEEARPAVALDSHLDDIESELHNTMQFEVAAKALANGTEAASRHRQVDYIRLRPCTNNSPTSTGSRRAEALE
jgi:hypothetical protein